MTALPGLPGYAEIREWQIDAGHDSMTVDLMLWMGRRCVFTECLAGEDYVDCDDCRYHWRGLE